MVSENWGVGQVAISSTVPTPVSVGPLNGNPVNGIRIKNKAGNGIIYVGDFNVSATVGYPLAADEWIEIPTNKIGEIYALAVTNTQKLAFVWG